MTVACLRAIYSTDISTTSNYAGFPRVFRTLIVWNCFQFPTRFRARSRASHRSFTGANEQQQNVILCTLRGVSCLFCLVFVYIILYYSMLPLNVNKIVVQNVSTLSFSNWLSWRYTIATSHPVGVRNIAISVSVCLLFVVCLAARIF